jgi:hypothetical protein
MNSWVTLPVVAVTSYKITRRREEKVMFFCALDAQIFFHTRQNFYHMPRTADKMSPLLKGLSNGLVSFCFHVYINRYINNSN